MERSTKLNGEINKIKMERSTKLKWRDQQN